MSKFNKGLLFPVDKFHEIGPFRFPIHNDLIPAEVKKIAAIEKEFSKGTYESMRLAKRIAKDRGITNKEAVELLQNPNAEGNEGVVYDYIDEIQALNNAQDENIAKLQAYALMLLQFRGQVKNPETEGWDSTEDWEMEDTANIPTKVLNSMFDFIMWERDGWPTPEAVGNEKTKTPSPRRAT